jgi:hypothetical protein
MRTLTLKMRDSPNFFQHGGQRGDHRMVQLVIPLPKERLPEIVSCVALFSCDNELALSPLILPVDPPQRTCGFAGDPGDSGDCYIADGKAHIVLWQRLTQCWVLRVQLECFGDFEGQQFISRTEISEKVVFGKSLADSLEHIPEAEQEPNAIAQLLATMHRHGNMTVLEELGDLAGDLTYHGEALVTEPLTNLEINSLINQALAALG